MATYPSISGKVCAGEDDEEDEEDEQQGMQFEICHIKNIQRT